MNVCKEYELRAQGEGKSGPIYFPEEGSRWVLHGSRLACNSTSLDAVAEGVMRRTGAGLIFRVSFDSLVLVYIIDTGTNI